MGKEVLAGTNGPTGTGKAAENPVDRSAQLIARIESIPFSKWHIKLRVIMGSATFFDAYDALTLAYVLPVLNSVWKLSVAQTGLIIASGYLGQAIGAVIFGILAEKYGRLFSAKWAIFIMSVMGFGCMMAGNYNVLFTLRFIQGIGVGGEIPTAAAYINELSRAKGRGKFFMVYELIFPISLMITAQLGAAIVPSLGWKWMFLIGSVGGLVIIALLFKLHESPRWLISKGRFDEAEKVIEEMEASTTERLPVTVSVPNVAKKPSAKELFSPIYCKRTLIVWGLWFTTYFVSNGLNNWLPSLYKTVYKLSLSDSLHAASLTNVVQVVLVVACAFLIDKVGRRKWVVAAFPIAAALLITLWLIGGKSPVSVMALGSSAYGVVGTVTVLLYLYTPEIYPTRMRALGTSFATAWLRLASAIGPTVLAFVLGAKGITSVFLMFAIICVIGAILGTQMIETREKVLEDIAP